MPNRNGLTGILLPDMVPLQVTGHGLRHLQVLKVPHLLGLDLQGNGVVIDQCTMVRLVLVHLPGLGVLASRQ